MGIIPIPIEGTSQVIIIIAYVTAVATTGPTLTQVTELFISTALGIIPGMETTTGLPGAMDMEDITHLSGAMDMEVITHLVIDLVAEVIPPHAGGTSHTRS